MARIARRMVHPSLGMEKVGGKGDALAYTCALVSILLVTRPGGTPVWVGNLFSKEGGYGGHTVPPDALAQSGWWSCGLLGESSLLPTQVVRELHYRWCVEPLSRRLGFNTLGEACGAPSMMCFYGTPLFWPFLLWFCLAADGILLLVLGPLAVVEVLVFAVRYAVFTPGQLKIHAAQRLRRLKEQGKPEGIGFNYKGECTDFALSLVVPSVNSYTLAASFLLTAVLLYIEVFNIVLDVAPGRDRDTCYVILGVQVTLSGTPACPPTACPALPCVRKRRLACAPFGSLGVGCL